MENDGSKCFEKKKIIISVELVKLHKK